MSDNKAVALQSINYVRRLLNRFEKVLKGGNDKFTTLELKDLIDILGLETFELQEFLNLTDSEIYQVEQYLD